VSAGNGANGMSGANGRVSADGASPTLVLVDEHEALRDGLSVLLERRGFRVLGCGSSAADGRERVGSCEPDVTLLGLALPDESGADLTRRLIAENPARRIVIYTGVTDPMRIADALRSGARGFVAKPGGIAALIDALRQVCSGGGYVDPKLIALTKADGVTRQRLLSAREAEVLTMLANGETGEQIAGRLGLSPETIRTHIRNAMEKLEAHTRTEAVVKALDREEIRRPSAMPR
jgi:DNA-binding NarL/FixJ family response regulator